MINLPRTLSIGSLLLLVALSLSTINLVASPACPADLTWLTSPSMPTEVKKSVSGTESNFCDFYQFSWQAYLYLISPSLNNNSLRNFQVLNNYPLLEFNSDGSPANSCDETITGTTLQTTLDKTSSSTGQAGGNKTIYAQDGNVIYYDVRFDKATCYLSGSAVDMLKNNISNFPGGTTELKFAWKVLNKTEIQSGTFITQSQIIGSQHKTLGLVGMHIAVATPNHPEFVWATFERDANSPDCTPPSHTQSASGWIFADKSCTSGLPNSAKNEKKPCKFNQAVNHSTSPTSTPTNICRVYPDGAADGDYNADKNRADIAALNTIIRRWLAESNQPLMNNAANYFNVGALWISNINKPSSVSNQRGSLRLANTVAETTHQNVDLNSGFVSNCFGCHNFKGRAEPVNNNITSQHLSHIFAEVQIGQGKFVDVTSSTFIGSNASAPDICSGSKGACQSASPFLRWNGQWTNINPGTSSVCGCGQQ